MNRKQTKKAFTLIELLVVMAILSLLLAVTLPAMRRAREQVWETVCRSNLRQMALVLRNYGSDNDHRFPYPPDLFHSYASMQEPYWRIYLPCCRWHDARIGLDSELLRHEHPEWRGTLWPYLGDTRIVRCRVGVRANIARGCSNACVNCAHDPKIDIVPQYTYAMNSHLSSTITTVGVVATALESHMDSGTYRTTPVYKETQVTRSPSQVFVFGEENSWAINIEGRQPIGVKPGWAAPYELSGKYHLEMRPIRGHLGTLGCPELDVVPTYRELNNRLVKDDLYVGAAFTTYHRPPKGNLNAGYSYVVMLDGHTEKVTVADQLRRSRRVSGMEDSRLGPGGNLALAWPIDIPPPGGWDNQ